MHSDGHVYSPFKQYSPLTHTHFIYFLSDQCGCLIWWLFCTYSLRVQNKDKFFTQLHLEMEGVLHFLLVIIQWDGVKKCLAHISEVRIFFVSTATSLWIWRKQKAKELHEEVTGRLTDLQTPTCVRRGQRERAAFWWAKVIQRTLQNGAKRKRSMKEDRPSCSEKTAQDNGRVSLGKQTPIPPAPSKLPPANLLRQDILMVWYQQLKHQRPEIRCN